MAGFSIPLDKLAAKMQADLETVVRKSTFDMYTRVKQKSAVDTGRFRTNWNVSQGAVNTATTESTDQSRADREIEKVWTLPIGGVMYMANSLPYARVLEYGGYPNPPKNPTGKTVGGFSKQTPQGMVRITALEFTQAVQKAIGEL